jgi:hypothetical protein
VIGYTHLQNFIFYFKMVAMNKGIFGSMFGIVLVAAYYLFFSGSGAVKYNDRIIDNQNEIVDEFERFFDALEKGSVGEMRMALADLKVEIDEAIDDVSGMSDYKGNTAFRDKAIEVFEFYDTVASEDCPELIEIFQQGSDAFNDYDRQRIEEIVMGFQEDEDAYLDELDKIQRRFAKEHNFQVQRRR